MKTDQPKAAVTKTAMLRKVIFGLALVGGLALGAFGARLTVDSVCRTLDDVVERAVRALG